VEASHAAAHSQLDGRGYDFCSAECQQRFDADPQRFVAPHAAPVPCCGFGMVRPTHQRGNA
jgi:YHS domain-containing protein